MFFYCHITWNVRIEVFAAGSGCFHMMKPMTYNKALRSVGTVMMTQYSEYTMIRSDNKVGTHMIYPNYNGTDDEHS